MSKPAREFELADALRHARSVRDDAETALAEARQAWRQARAHQQEIAETLKALDAQRTACGTLDAAQVAARAAYRAHVQQRLREATRAVALAEHAVQQRRRALDEARQRVEALEALEAQHRKARLRWQMQREQDAADELAATRGAARRRHQAQ